MKIRIWLGRVPGCSKTNPPSCLTQCPRATLGALLADSPGAGGIPSEDAGTRISSGSIAGTKSPLRRSFISRS